MIERIRICINPIDGALAIIVVLSRRTQHVCARAGLRDPRSFSTGIQDHIVSLCYEQSSGCIHTLQPHSDGAPNDSNARVHYHATISAAGVPQKTYSSPYAKHLVVGFLPWMPGDIPRTLIIITANPLQSAQCPINRNILSI